MMSLLSSSPVTQIRALKQASLFQSKPSIILSSSEKNSLVEKLKYVPVGKFSHGRPPMAAIKHTFAALKLQGKINISPADYKHIFIECSSILDFHAIWLKLAWSIDGLVMRIFKCDCNFSPLVESPIAPVWIRIQGLPLYLFDEMSLLDISNAIGTPICIDPSNLNRSYLSSAKICVELDTSKPLIDAIWIGIKDDKSECLVDGFWVYVFYDVLPGYCTCCKHIGHSETKCKRKKVEGMFRQDCDDAQQDPGNRSRHHVKYGNNSTTVDISVSSVSLHPQFNTIESRKVNHLKVADASAVLENVPSICNEVLPSSCSERKDEAQVRQIRGGAEQANSEEINSTVGKSVQPVAMVQLPSESWHTVGKNNSGSYSKNNAVNAQQSDTFVSNSFNFLKDSVHNTTNITALSGLESQHKALVVTQATLAHSKLNSQNQTVAHPDAQISKPEVMEFEKVSSDLTASAEAMQESSQGNNKLMEHGSDRLPCVLSGHTVGRKKVGKEDNEIQKSTAEEALGVEQNGFVPGVEEKQITGVPSAAVHSGGNNTDEYCIEAVPDISETRKGTDGQQEWKEHTPVQISKKESKTQGEVVSAANSTLTPNQQEPKRDSEIEGNTEDITVEASLALQQTPQSKTDRVEVVSAVQTTSWAERMEEGDQQNTHSSKKNGAVHSSQQAIEKAKGILEQGPIQLAKINKFGKLKYCDEIEQKKGAQEVKRTQKFHM